MKPKKSASIPFSCCKYSWFMKYSCKQSSTKCNLYLSAIEILLSMTSRQLIAMPSVISQTALWIACIRYTESTYRSVKVASTFCIFLWFQQRCTMPRPLILKLSHRYGSRRQLAKILNCRNWIFKPYLFKLQIQFLVNLLHVTLYQHDSEAGLTLMKSYRTRWVTKFIWLKGISAFLQDELIWKFPFFQILSLVWTLLRFL